MEPQKNEIDPFESPESERPLEESDTHDPIPSVDAIRGYNQDHIHEVAGAQMAGSKSLNDLQRNIAVSNTDRTSNSDNSAEALKQELLADAAQRLEDIEHLATELVQKNMEHRVKDFRDRFPVFSNIRSHKLATREGEIITQIKEDVAVLQSMALQHGLGLDLTKLAELTDYMKAPEGFTKWATTIFAPEARTFHRSVFITAAEKLKAEASQLRRMSRKQSRVESHSRMAA